MRDFLAEHQARQPQAPRPRITRVKPPPPSAKPGTPDWMADFSAKPTAPSASPAPREEKAAPASAASAKKPDWMSDFED